ncbi:hypothetical protein D3C86_45220 [compost metagenome]
MWIIQNHSRVPFLWIDSLFNMLLPNFMIILDFFRQQYYYKSKGFIVLIKKRI